MNISLGGLQRRVDQLEQAPLLSSDIPPGIILFPLESLDATEYDYVLAMPAGVSEYAPGYVLINPRELSWEELDAMVAITRRHGL